MEPEKISVICKRGEEVQISRQASMTCPFFKSGLSLEGKFSVPFEARTIQLAARYLDLHTSSQGPRLSRPLPVVDPLQELQDVDKVFVGSLKSDEVIALTDAADFLGLDSLLDVLAAATAARWRSVPVRDLQDAVELLSPTRRFQSRDYVSDNRIEEEIEQLEKERRTLSGRGM